MFPGVSSGKTTTAPFDYRLPQIFTLPEIMVKTLPDNELKAMLNPFWQYKFAAGDLSSNEWQLSGIDVSRLAQCLLSLAIVSTRSRANNANSSPLPRCVTTRSATAAMMRPPSLL